MHEELYPAKIAAHVHHTVHHVTAESAVPFAVCRMRRHRFAFLFALRCKYKKISEQIVPSAAFFRFRA